MACPLERKTWLISVVLAWARAVLGWPLILARSWIVALGTALAVRLSLHRLFKLLGQELFVDPIQGVSDELGLEPVGRCLKMHLCLERAPLSVEFSAVMLGMNCMDLQ